MSFVMKTNTANSGNYGGSRALSKIKYIVIHFTANDGDTDEGNGKYFHNNVVKASAHYFVDSDSVTHSVPDGRVAWSVGGSKYGDCAQTGGGSLYGVVNNTNSISIELCDDRKDGAIYPSAATIENALELTRQLMEKYGVPVERVIRHFDVTGKHCPDYWCGTAAKNAAWLSEFRDRLGGAPAAEDPTPVLVYGYVGEVVKRLQTILNGLSFGPLDVDGSFGPATLAAVKAFQQSNGLDADGSVGPLTWGKLLGDPVPAPTEPPAPAETEIPVWYLVRVTAAVLNVRKGPGVRYGISTKIYGGEVYTVVAERDGWGKLKSGAGWINLAYTVRK